MSANNVSLNEIPDSFSIANYARTVDLDARGWADNLALRLGCRNQIELAQSNPTIRETAIQLCEDILRNPISDAYTGWRPGIDMIQVTEPTMTVGDQSALQFMNQVSDFQALSFTNELKKKYELADQPRYRHGVEVPGVDNARAELSATPYWRLFGNTPGNRTALASVDINAPDDVLLRDFQSWLKVVRSAANVEGRQSMYAKEDFAKWSAMRVLAYIDLSLWAASRQSKIKLPVMGRTLFPDEFAIGLEDRVRKVIARDARTLLSIETIRTLRAQG